MKKKMILAVVVAAVVAFSGIAPGSRRIELL